MSNPVLSVSGVHKSYRDGSSEVPVLSGVDLRVAAGERLAILGSSGSGKSTLLNILGGLDKPDGGEVEVAGEALFQVSEVRRAALRNRYLGFVYQFHHLLNEFTALENVAMPLLIARQSASDARKEAQMLLERVGLSHRVKHKPGQLSGGERQRVAIARALVCRPACVLMDEPTGNLDRHTAEEVEKYLDKLNKESGIAFITVTHDLALARRMDRAVEIVDGKLQHWSDQSA
ncbi:Lipoprotein releasing system ATP-binding protein LolD [Marinobacterium lacunae]|uniref:Lipoprotein-releasing system ATP-binding protein LolD n=1 Tax=Marinobacterium lacunae TaxID=1232683 RepID=A0A081FTZ4_9GAMM|nr:lipoprotein-releasing ABC transporter ATP-binding protein LolD [Marinobacterium lacunae]KEA61999.1 Lipoprotein releasing system ATP-binding protein LolD [Marinobacterium lacunae]